MAGVALSRLGSLGKGRFLERGRRAKGVTPERLLVAMLVAISAVSIAAICGASLSSLLPVGFAAFSSSLLACLAWGQVEPDIAARAPASSAQPDHLLLNRLPGLITRHDSQGALLAVHGADRLALGFGRTNQPGAFLEAIHIAGRINYLQAVDALRQGAVSASAEFMLVGRGDETFIPVRAILSAEFDADGALSGYLTHTQPMGEVSALREDVARWQGEARSANDAKTRFLAAVSHELRTPLNAVLGFSEILLGEYFGKFENDRQKEYVQLINQSGNHLLAVVNTMLDMSKIEAGRYELLKEPFAVAGVIHAVDEMLGLEARRKGVVLNTRVARGVDEVVADRRAIQQVLINLANNAIKFTPEGGVVSIDVANDKSSLLLTVSDTGIGIPADRLAEIGRPFMQVQNDYTRKYEGTGLGLALVKGLVSLHGGSFAIESEEGRGTVITVRVPLDGEGEAGAETFEFPPRLKHAETGESRHGAAQAKIA